jgi:hypothetical protein
MIGPPLDRVHTITAADLLPGDLLPGDLLSGDLLPGDLLPGHLRQALEAIVRSSRGAHYRN